MRRLNILTAAAALALATAAQAKTIQGILNPEETRTVTERVQKIRALKFEHPVPFSYLTVDQSQARLRAELARDTTPAELELEAREGELAGLYPPNTDLARDNLTMLKSQLAGFYDPRRKDMVIIERPVSANPAVNPRLIEYALKLRTAGVLSHELTHALQDQHFDIQAEQKAALGNADRELALHALIEGDATLSGFCSVVGRADDSTIGYFLDNSADASVIFLGSAKGLGVQMRKLLIFPYLDGARFVAQAYHRGGWAAVDAIYRNPPRSSRQILHPEMYFDHPEAPVEVHVAGYEKILAAWKKADEDTFGELVLRMVIEHWIGEQTPYVAAADGWAGDRFVALRKSTDLTLAWIIAFHNPGQAENFAALYPRILAKSLPGLTARHVERKGNAVLVLIGDGAIRFHELAPAIWKSSTIGGHPIADAAIAQPPWMIRNQA